MLCGLIKELVNIITLEMYLLALDGFSFFLRKARLLHFMLTVLGLVAREEEAALMASSVT